MIWFFILYKFTAGEFNVVEQIWRSLTQANEPQRMKEEIEQLP